MNSREAFEAWAKSRFFDMRRRENGEYWTTDSNTQAMWLLWRAARLAAIEECAKVCNERDLHDNSEESIEAVRCAQAIRALAEKGE